MRSMSLLAAVLALTGCGSTLVSGRALGTGDYQDWTARIETVPVELHGNLPGRDQASLAALATPTARPVRFAGPITSMTDSAAAGGARLVLVIGPRGEPAPGSLCRDAAAVQFAPPAGDRARIVAVLCDGATPLAVTNGSILAGNRSDDEIRDAFETIRQETARSFVQPPPDAF